MQVDYNNILSQVTTQHKQLYIEQVLNNIYIPNTVEPYYEQALIILDEITTQSPKNRLVAGGAYSGKSQLVAIDACRFLSYPDYTALLIRNTFPQIKQPGEVVDKLNTWLTDKKRLGPYTCKHQKQDHYFEAPSGAKIYYGSCDTEGQMDKIRGSSYNRIYSIEASEIPGPVNSFINRSVRPKDGNNSNIQEMCMYVTNPSFGPGADYIKKTFIQKGSKLKYYNLDLMMNDKVPRERYDERLAQMSPEQQAFMRYGDWNFTATDGLLLSGTQFDTAQISPQDYSYEDVVYSIIGVDLAGEGDDYTSLTSFFVTNYGKVIIDDNMLIGDAMVEDMMAYFIAKQQDKAIINNVVVEQEGGSMTVYAVRHFEEALEHIQDRYRFTLEYFPTKGMSKFNRAKPLANNLIQKDVLINKEIPNKHEMRNQFMYLHPLKEEMKKYPSPDIADSCSVAFNYMIENLNIEGYIRRHKHKKKKRNKKNEIA